MLRLVGALGRVPWGARTPTVPPADAVDPLADEDPWVRATARLNRALTLVTAGRLHTEAETDLQAALAEFRALDERLGISSALTALAGLAEWRGDLATAVSCYEQAVAAVTEVVPGEDVWLMRLRLAQLRWLLGDTEGSAAAMAQAERDTERIGLPDALVAVAYAKAELARWAGEPRTARTQLTRAEALSRHITVNWQFRAMIRGSLGYLDADEGDLDAARAHHDRRARSGHCAPGAHRRSARRWSASRTWRCSGAGHTRPPGCWRRAPRCAVRRSCPSPTRPGWRRPPGPHSARRSSPRRRGAARTRPSRRCARSPPSPSAPLGSHEVAYQEVPSAPDDVVLVADEDVLGAGDDEQVEVLVGGDQPVDQPQRQVTGRRCRPDSPWTSSSLPSRPVGDAPRWTARASVSASYGPS